MRELLTAECLTTSPAEDHASLSSLSVDHDKKKKKKSCFFNNRGQGQLLGRKRSIKAILVWGERCETPNQFPNVKNIYTKYNTLTPFSAPVERLFG